MSRHLRIAAILVLCLSCAEPARADDTLGIDVVLPLTGGAAFVGQGGRRVIEAEEKLINSEGGVHGHPIKFVFHDDQTSPQVAVQNVSRLKDASVILGSGLSAMCNAMLPLVASKGPFTYCLSPAVHPPVGSYMFSTLIPLTAISPAVLSFFRAKGWTSLALMFSTDASGQDAERGFDDALKRPENAGIRVVAREHFDPTALSVSAQMETVKAAKPQVLIGWASGAPQVTLLKGYSQAALDVPILIGQANLAYQFMEQNAAILPKEFYLSSGLGTARGGKMTLDPRVAAARALYFKTLDGAGIPVENAGEAVWDGVRLTIRALQALPEKPSAEQVLAYMSAVKDFAGISGIYDFVQYPQRGLTGQEVVIVRWNPATKQFDSITEPGGALVR